MKSIILHTAAVDNDGRRRDPGEGVPVGADGGAIAADRAAALVADGLAVAGPAAAARRASAPMSEIEPGAHSGESSETEA